MDRRNLVVLIIMVLVLAVAGWFTYKALYPTEDSANSEAARSLVGEKNGVAISYLDLDGNPVELSQYAGRIRIVNSWASWTPFSKDELKALEALAADLPLEEGVVIAINRAEPASKIKAYLGTVGKFEKIIFLQDSEDVFYDSVGGFAMPETIFYDETGQIIFHKRGRMTLEEMQQQLSNIRTKTTD